MLFSELFKKRGFYETLYTLYNAKNYTLIFPEFFERLGEMGSYYNAFFRVKEDLVNHGLIEFKKNRTNEKIIRLTKKGIEITKILKKIDSLVDLPFEEYKNKIKKINKQKKARSKKLTQKEKNSEQNSSSESSSSSDPNQSN